MLYEVKFADIGEGLEEGEVLEIYVEEGQQIEIEQQLLEVHTEKVTTDITAAVGGTIKEIRIEVGEIIKVGQIIMTIEPDKEPPKKERPSKKDTEEMIDEEPGEEEKGLFQPTKPTRTGREKKRKKRRGIVNERVLAPPAVRQRARSEGVDLRYVEGSGPGGRIGHDDLDAFLDIEEPESKRPQRKPRRRIDLKPGQETRIPLKGTRKTIARAMRRSKDHAAHYTYFEEVDMTALDDLREKLKPIMDANGIKITYVALVMKCLVLALREFPMLNAELDEEKEEIVLRDYYNIGISVDTDEGLIVPVVKHVEQKSIWEVADEVVELANRARKGELQLDDISGGTFTITSIGNIGGVMATPIIKYPEVAILGLMQAKLRPVVVEKYGKPEIAIRKMMYLSLSLDHRIVDGAIGARFIRELIKYMENPALVWMDEA